MIFTVHVNIIQFLKYLVKSQEQGKERKIN